MNILAFDTCFDGCSVCVAERRGGRCRAAQFSDGALRNGSRRAADPDDRRGDAASAPQLRSPGPHRGDRRTRHLHRHADRRRRGPRLGSRDRCADDRRFESWRSWRKSRGARSPHPRLAVVVDARRGEVYAQLFGAGGGLDAKSPPQLLSIEDAAKLGDGAIVFVGSGGAAVAAAARDRPRRGRPAT